MRRSSWGTVVAVGIVVLAGAWYWWGHRPAPVRPPTPAEISPPTSAPMPPSPTGNGFSGRPAFAVPDVSGGLWVGFLHAGHLQLWHVGAAGPTEAGGYAWAGPPPALALDTPLGLWLATATTVTRIVPASKAAPRSWTVATGQRAVEYLAPSSDGVWVTVGVAGQAGAAAPVELVAIDPTAPAVTPILAAQSSAAAAFAPAPGGLAFGLLAGPGPNAKPLGYWGLFSPSQGRLLQQNALPGGAEGRLVEPAGGPEEVVATAPTLTGGGPQVVVLDVATARVRPIPLPTQAAQVVGLWRSTDGSRGVVWARRTAATGTVLAWQHGRATAVATVPAGALAAADAHAVYIFTAQGMRRIPW
ncbi:MAG: hypothetical protein K6U14_04550 [Firmicutes bacterium]|nr:hypothetical protein [Alicyclobacillaceae bacterium]MCL6496892.1 hypothetical protein [Bacillota bacterium]